MNTPAARRRTTLVSRIACAAFAVASFAALVPQPGTAPFGASCDAHAKGKAEVPVVEGADTKERVQNARTMAAEDPARLAAALISIADAKPKKDAAQTEVDFLAAYLVGEHVRVLRLLALDSAVRIDSDLTAAALRPHVVPDDALVASNAAEALGYVGDKTDTESLASLARLPRLDVAPAAIRAIARIGDKKTATPVLVELALTHEIAEMGDEAAWALQDILKKPEAVAAKLRKGAGKDEVKKVRAASIAAVIEDELAEPHKWDRKSLEKLRKLVQDAPDEITVVADVKQRKAKAEAAIAWLAENMPGHAYELRVAVKSVDFPLKPETNRFLDREDPAVGIPTGLKGVSYLKQSERQIAYHVLRSAVVVLEARMGNPSRGRRGWHNGLHDAYDVCKVAGLYSAADGADRHDVVEQIYLLQSPPWRGE